LAAVEPEVANWASVLAVALEGKSYSDIARELAAARRRAALNGASLSDQLAELIRPEKMSKHARIDLAVSLVNRGIMSERKARELTGVARDTIRSRKRSGTNNGGAERSEE
jgi:hypothetical protein